MTGNRFRLCAGVLGFCIAIGATAAFGHNHQPPVPEKVCEPKSAMIGDWRAVVTYDGYELIQQVAAEGEKGSSFKAVVYRRDTYGNQTLQLEGYRINGKPIRVPDYEQAFEYSEVAHGYYMQVHLASKNADETQKVRAGSDEEIFESLNLNLASAFDMRAFEKQSLLSGGKIAFDIKAEKVFVHGEISGDGFGNALQWAKAIQWLFVRSVSARKCPDFQQINPDHQNEDGEAGAS